MRSARFSLFSPMVIFLLCDRDVLQPIFLPADKAFITNRFLAMGGTCHQGLWTSPPKWCASHLANDAGVRSLGGWCGQDGRTFVWGLTRGSADPSLLSGDLGGLVPFEHVKMFGNIGLILFRKQF